MRRNQVTMEWKGTWTLEAASAFAEALGAQSFETWAQRLEAVENHEEAFGEHVFRESGTHPERRWDPPWEKDDPSSR